VSALWRQITILRPGWLDLVEVLIVAFLLYRLLVLLRRPRTMQMFFGLVLLAGVYVAARLLGFVLIRGILEAVFQYGAIAALVVFQPELRGALARLGQNRMFRLFNRLEGSKVIDEITEAVEQLSRNKVGAILVLKQDSPLDDYIESGQPLDARVSAVLIATVFAPNSPLHDGALVIADDHIQAAGVILPLTETPLFDRTLGTRHRAALGLVEETDAVAIVVSEETSRISVAHQGHLDVGITPARLREVLTGVVPEGAPPLPAA
jgi:diadenylate cyclase